MSDEVPVVPVPTPKRSRRNELVIVAILAPWALLLGAASVFAWVHWHGPQRPALVVPADVSATAGVITDLAADTTAKDVVWEPMSGPCPLSWERHDNRTMHFSAPLPGDYHVVALAIVGGQTVKASTTIHATPYSPGPTPPPVPPGPGPTPPPLPGQHLHVTAVIDTASRTPEQAKLLDSEELIALMQKGGHHWRIYDSGNPTLVERRLKPLADACGVPCVIFQGDDGRPVGGTAYKLPATVADFGALLRKVGG